MKIGVLTGGGDCPGLNAVIRAIVRKGIFHHGDEFIGFSEGWRGVMDDKTQPLDLAAVKGILPRGGTILRTSRTNPSKNPNGIQQCINTLKKHHCDVLIALGGDDTQSVALKIYQAGFPVVGVPKTIDNDLTGTDFCFGFDTAVEIATEAVDRVHSTAESHNRVIVVEVMGRDSGWIAMYSGIAGGADVILIPERPFNIEEVSEILRRRHSHGHDFSIVVAAEGAHLAVDSDKKNGSSVLQDSTLDEFGHVKLGGIGYALAKEIERRTGFETRAVVLGHTQRGGTPSAFDRVLATRYGVKAIDMVHEGKFGQMAAIHGTEMVSVPIQTALGQNRKVDPALIETADSLYEALGEEKAAD
jgi:ATP-dependent phosphofructokinase / diphosphate-dependent phosphofructokinase